MMRFLNRPAIHLLAITLFTVLAYANTFNIPFQLDDTGNILFNPAIKSFDCFLNPDKLGTPGYLLNDKALFKTRYIGYLTFAVDYAVHGLDVRGYHLVNLLIHLCTSLLLYGLIVLTFKTPRLLRYSGHSEQTTGTRNFIAFFSALLFAVHPIQTQAVTYIVQRFASLATMLWLVSLLCYVRFRLQSENASGPVRRTALFALSLLSAVLAMKTKEFALLLPVVVTLYDLMFFEGGFKKRALYLTPLLLTTVTVPLSVMTTTSSGLEKSAAKLSGAETFISRSDYLFTQFRVIVTYIRLLLLPIHQRFDYDYPIYRSFFIPEVVASCGFLLLILCGGIYLFRLSRKSATKNRHLYLLLSFGIFWFFITISAESSIIPIYDVIFEHRLYLPSIGFILSLVSAAELLRVRWGARMPSVPAVSVYALLAVTTVFATATYARNAVWGDKVGFLENEVRRSPGKERTRTLLGVMYGELGRMDEAVYQLRTAIATNPAYGGSHYNLAITYARMGRLDDAVDEYRRTIGLKFDYADAHTGLGEVYEQQGRLEEASREYSIALRLSPQSETARNDLMSLNRKLLNRGRTE